MENVKCQGLVFGLCYKWKDKFFNEIMKTVLHNYLIWQQCAGWTGKRQNEVRVQIDQLENLKQHIRINDSLNGNGKEYKGC